MKEQFNSRRVTSLLFILAIAVVFTLQFGPGSRGCEARQDLTGSTVAAQVNGKEISARDFAREYQTRIQQFQGQGISPDLLKQLGIPRQVLDRMVDTELWAQAAERHGVVASDEELRTFLFDIPLFQKDGQFDAQVYQQNVRGFLGKSVTDFESELRRQLSAQKMMDVVRASATVSDDEVKARFLKEGNTAALTSVRFLPAMFADQVKAPTDAQLAEVKKSQAEAIKKQYEQNLFLYNTPERIRARHILVKLPEGATAEQKEAARKKLADVRAQVEGGKDFAELARQVSEDPGTKASGGELGWVERATWEQALATAAFPLEPGQMTQPVQTRLGMHLVKVEEKRPPQTKKLEEVEGEIARQLFTKEQARTLARQAAEDALAKAKAGQALTALFPAPKADEKQPQQPPRPAAESKPEARESGPFNAAMDTIPGLGPAPELMKATFAATGPTTLDQVFSAGEAFVVATVTERKQPADADFEAKKEELRAEARSAKEFELQDSYVKQLKKDANVVVNEQVVSEVIGS
jgi:peptidyl-prolyl cis-trans isomerase D